MNASESELVCDAWSNPALAIVASHVVPKGWHLPWSSVPSVTTILSSSLCGFNDLFFIHCHVHYDHTQH